MDTIRELIIDFWVYEKLAILFFLGMYLIFASVMVKQAKLMTETLDVELDSFIVSVSYVHLAIAVGIFIASVVLL